MFRRNSKVLLEKHHLISTCLTAFKSVLLLIAIFSNLAFGSHKSPYDLQSVFLSKCLHCLQKPLYFAIFCCLAGPIRYHKRFIENKTGNKK